MKKFLKILLIVIGIVFLIFAALICIGLFVDYDDHIENGRYTYVPEDDNKDNAYVEFNLSDYDKKDSELIYYSSVEEAPGYGSFPDQIHSCSGHCLPD